MCLWDSHTTQSYQERLIITDVHYAVKSSYKTHPALKSGISLRGFPCCKRQVAMQLPRADPRPGEKTSHVMEPVQARDGSREPPCRAEWGLASSFLTQVMFRAEPLAGWAGVFRGWPAAWSCCSGGTSPAQPRGNPGWLKGLCTYFHGC